MQSPLYEELASLFVKIGFTEREGPELKELLRFLFTEEEARVALNLSSGSPEPPESVAQRMGADLEGVSRLLEAMADKGLIYCLEKGGRRFYKVIQLVPGIFELQLMKGEVTERTKELARLFDAYFGAQQTLGEGKRSTSFARVIPVNKEVCQPMEIFPYEDAIRYIEQADVISLSICYCRHKQRLLGKGCDHPDDVCIQLGPFARFIIQRGFGRQITKEEAKEVLRLSEKAGLVHTSSNTRDRVDFICNCCSCCCMLLRSVKSSSMPSLVVSSNYFASVDEGICIGCGECEERCQMAAIFVNGDVAEVSEDRCIGCGVCASGCPEEAIRLVPRPQIVEPPRDFSELRRRLAPPGNRRD